LAIADDPLPSWLVMRSAAALFAFLSLVPAATACSSGPAVARVVNGHDIDGRFIAPEAYAAYLEGALFEEQGNAKAAEAAYVRALGEDSGAGEIWAHLGRVRCSTDQRASDGNFAKARSLGPNVGEVWLSDARCGLERGDAARARRSAERAAALDPRNVEASLLVVEALVRSGDRAAADRWLHAARLLYPEAAGLPDSLEAVSASSRRNPAQADPPTRPRPWARRDAVEAVDGALRIGDADAARSAAVRAHLGTGWLALRAVELGQVNLAKETAEMTLAAEPGNVEARVAALAAADLSHDESAFRKWTSPLPADADTTSALAARVMAALLERRVGAGPGRAFTEGWATLHPSAGGAPAK
jgi:tetratricopeptide (TPR) repeat protein